MIVAKISYKLTFFNMFSQFEHIPLYVVHHYFCQSSVQVTENGEKLLLDKNILMSG